MHANANTQDFQDIALTRQGDDGAFTRLVERYKTPVFNLCYRMLGDPDLAEDAAQESFLRAYRNLGRFDIQRSFASWLLAIAAHYCIDTLRRRKYHLVSIHQTSDGDDREMELIDLYAVNPEDEWIHAEASHHVHLVLAKLKATDRAAVVLRYWHEFSEAEISETLGLSIPAVKARLFRARQEIANSLTKKPEQHLPAASLFLTQACQL